MTTTTQTPHRLDALAALDDPYLVEHEQQISTHRGKLGSALLDAQKALTEARRQLDALRSSHVYDIEIVEGFDGDDLASFLDTANRDTRGALAILRALPD